MADEWVEFGSADDYGIEFDVDFGGTASVDGIVTSNEVSSAGSTTTEVVPGLSIPELASVNFNGSIPRERVYVSKSSIVAGMQIYLKEDDSPYSDTGYTWTELELAYPVVLKETNSISVIKENTVISLDITSWASSVYVIQESWDNRDDGTSGWAITSGGNAIFTNVAVRGQIEATSGSFGDWTVGDYEGYDGLYYTFNSGGEILESAVTPTNVYLKADSTIFGSNFSWLINSIPNPDGHMIVLKNLDNSSSPLDLQPIFYVSDTGNLYSLSATFENGLISNGNFSTTSDSNSSPAADISTNFTGNNAIYVHQYNTGQTATIVRLDAARTSLLSSNFFIRAFSAVGTASDEEFQVQLNGVVRGDGAYSSPTADYAEFFEWEDGNVNGEDRVGYSVSVINNKIKIAEPGEVPIGIISATPSIVGDSPWNRWKDKYLKDDFGREIYEQCTSYQWEENGKLVNHFSDRIPEGVVVPEDKEVISSERKVLNPNFDSELEYVPRDERPEWDTVGMLGKIRLRKGQVTAPTWIKLRDISENVEEWLVK